MTSTGSEPRRCECRTMQPGNGEPYCPRHRYRWEYEQDEQNAHRALDELGAPRDMGPPPGDLILSVAGRIRALEVGSGHDEQTEGLLAVANQAGVSIHNANGPVLRMTLDEAVKLRDDFERALAVHGLGTVAAVVEALREDDRFTPPLPKTYAPAADFIEERFGSSVSGGE